MSSGLEFSEVYEPDQPSDTIAMLWGVGKDDVAHYAADKPLLYAPDRHWSYSSGTTNIVARVLARTLDAYGPDFEAFMRERLFAARHDQPDPQVRSGRNLHRLVLLFRHRPGLRPLRPALSARRGLGEPAPAARGLGRLCAHPDLPAGGCHRRRLRRSLVAGAGWRRLLLRQRP
uniref:Serine hydrolase n=1 Tax=Phenylobacterium glaciei TaxID=2803784 RepID=A0A974S7J3_9CAUL|nr:serine hydrolase [Phenylobacterium glaciei]